jgi:hypothetical protein
MNMALGVISITLHFIVTYEWAQYSSVALHYAGKACQRHSGLMGPFINYEQAEVLQLKSMMIKVHFQAFMINPAPPRAP